MNRERVERFLEGIPAHVIVVAAAKGRTPVQIMEVIEGGITVIGENYLQEAESAFQELDRKAHWHFIGHLQRNKVKRAVPIFDMIQTVDSFRLAAEIDRRCESLEKRMPVLVEVNSGREPQKSGVLPEEVRSLVEGMTELPWLVPSGLMTMGPRFGDPEEARPYFQETRRLFEGLSDLEPIQSTWNFLSMGMSNTYRIAIEEGANIIRVGTLLFGERDEAKGAA